MKSFLLTAFFCIALLSCNTKNDGVTLKESTGRINHLTLVINNDLWQGTIGDSLREVIANPILGLPQEEAQFSITQVPAKTFGKLFRASRNILFVGVAESDQYGVKKNLYAAPQTTMKIFGKDEASLVKQIEKYRKEIISVFKDEDLRVYQKKVTKNHWDTSTIKTLSKLKLDLKIPADYALVDDTGDFLWFRQNIDMGSMNLLAYALPMASLDSVAYNIVSARDTIGKRYIPGQTDGTYMITEKAYTPFTMATVVNDLPTYETRGKWEVKGDYMAGPFLNYTFIDKENKRLIVLEGFTYAPNVNKRDYMFELEAIIKTLKI